MINLATHICVTRPQWVKWLKILTGFFISTDLVRKLSVTLVACNITHEICDVIMGTMASQITSLAIVYSTIYSKLHVTFLCAGNSPVTGEFLAQSASNAENVCIRWRHYEVCALLCLAVVNPLRPRQNGRHIPDDIIKCIFLNENVWISLKISLKFVFKVPINNIPALF